MDTSEIRLMRAFLVLMAERGVSRAAARLGLSQPAASHLLTRLRVLFHDPLLLRARQGMVPTDRALELEGTVRELLAAYDGLIKPPERFNAASSQRTFTISMPEFAERLLMPRLLRHLRTHARNIRVVVRQPDTKRGNDMLETGELDMRVAWMISPLKSLRSTQLFQDRLVCIVDPKHSGVQGSLSLEQFFSLPRVITGSYSTMTTGQVIEDALRRHGEKPMATFTLQNMWSVVYSIPGTDLVAILPRMLANEYASGLGLQILESPLPLPAVRYSAFWHERQQKDPAHRWLRTTLQAVARGLAPSGG